ncbi:hypothetical protein, variant 1 [Aphanomyces invadans]|uniref:Helicase-associated domain-containing protein n=1 Tax=Aphanomyces invadans TaxID=157072 RepID=A0A024ULF2_9STRA|nr:hypothetical protein, variant 1 [Aphanomyces invadans]ETW06408.1 hypothetical protein, variant 1 [Aphanomyces invadans]|eukprot:XP_008864483.1 hypothetical protein, variant 1 [Aphanomyces invadans]
MQPSAKRKRRHNEDGSTRPSAKLLCRRNRPPPRRPSTSTSMVAAGDSLAAILNGKLHRFPEFVEAATVYHTLHHSKSAVTNLPKAFVVPSHPPYPVHLHGLKLNTAQVRTHVKNGNVHPETIAALRAINFVFDVNELKWQLKIQAFETYKALHGDLKIPQDFVVPRHDHRWPLDTWGMRLGLAVRSLRQKADMCPSRAAQLSAMGFVWNILEQGWEIKVLALSTYKDIYGDLLVPYSFKTPSETDYRANCPHEGLHRWPQETWNIKLGHAVHNLRQNVDDMPANRRDILNSMGFVWDCLELSWDLKLTALQRYKDLFGDVVVPYGFRVPKHDSQWPKDTWGLKLGHAVHNMHQQGLDMPQDRREALKCLGFVWEYAVDPVTWETNLQALHLYKKFHGHIDVPSHFKVPMPSHMWPQEMWDFQLGAVVGALRHHKHELPIHHRRSLDSMGFLWQRPVQPMLQCPRTFRAARGAAPVRRRWALQSPWLDSPTTWTTSPRKQIADEEVDSPATWLVVLDALHTYAWLYGDVVTIPANFIVPKDVNLWPRHTWQLPLGRWYQVLQRVDASRQRGESMDAMPDERYSTRAPVLPRLPEMNW